MDRLQRSDQMLDRQQRSRMVRLKKGEETPSGARLMTEDEVLIMQQKTIMNWQPRHEMWPFSWGVGILGGVGALSGMFINNFSRRQLGLTSLGRLQTYAPLVALPVIFSTFLHTAMVSNKILVGNFPCTVCASVRSGSLQTASAVGYPLILGPLVCMAMARKYHTYHIPAISETAQMLPLLRRVLPSPAAILALLIVNFGVGMAISERETFLFAKYLSPGSASLSDKEEELFE